MTAVSAPLVRWPVLVYRDEQDGVWVANCLPTDVVATHPDDPEAAAREVVELVEGALMDAYEETGDVTAALAQVWSEAPY